MLRLLVLATLLTLAASLAPAPARAARGTVVFAPPPAEVRAGDEIELAWTVEGEAPEEMELLLSVDDGRTFALRVSPQLDGYRRTWRWRVPDVPTAAARLRMRVGDHAGETDGPPSAAFRILSDPLAGVPGGMAVRVGSPRTHPRAHARPAAERPGPPRMHADGLVHEAGWWGGFGRLDGAAAGWLVSDGPVVRAFAALPPATVDERGPREAGAPPATAALAHDATPVASRAPVATSRMSLRPVRVPLRN